MMKKMVAISLFLVSFNSFAVTWSYMQNGEVYCVDRHGDIIWRGLCLLRWGGPIAPQGNGGVVESRELSTLDIEEARFQKDDPLSGLSKESYDEVMKKLEEY